MITKWKKSGQKEEKIHEEISQQICLCSCKKKLQKKSKLSQCGDMSVCCCWMVKDQLENGISLMLHKKIALVMRRLEMCWMLARWPFVNVKVDTKCSYV